MLQFDMGDIVDFVYEEEAYSGVKKVADWVRRDVRLVTDKLPRVRIARRGSLEIGASEGETADCSSGCVIFGTLGNSPLLDCMVKKGKLDVSRITGKREVYGFTILDEPVEGIDKALVIAGSDKRGTIYGLFHLSELLGVSPFVDWSDVKPQKQSTVTFDETVNTVSKEPSVTYRGFFLNDEWPAFGTFSLKHYGGMNAELYEMIFLLLLRLKGNYLWPAMWASCFAEEGPGLASAELADEYGVVMGLSHHEPCLRHGEEYRKLRGKDSPYGDAWDFRSNREGITRFWRDGLRRNGHLENVITLGMRGERDSAIMGKEATLQDNIDLIRDVITTQNQLIREEVNEKLTEVPRMLALYKEVEPFFYGDEAAGTKGLMGDECLSDVILLLCDDNHGYLRSRPDLQMRTHKGGYGLYYHFDYHGEPVSYEWVSSTHLPQVWEQLTEAYDTGIQELWIVNVGDLAFQELPLSYFMEMAYDYDSWGRTAVNKTAAFTRNWIEQQFAGDFTEEEKDMLCLVLQEANRLNHNRRPEHMSENVYHPVHNDEALRVYRQATKLVNRVELLERSCKKNQNAFQQLIAYQIKASMNYICMCLYRGWNHFTAAKGLVIANQFAEKIQECMELDERLQDEFHQVNAGKWDGLASASHIGFCNWNDEEAKNPIVETVLPIAKPRLQIGVCDSEQSTSGEEWTKKRLYVTSLQNPQAERAVFYIGLCSKAAVSFTVSCEDDRVTLSQHVGEVTLENPLVTIEITLQKDVGTGIPEQQERRKDHRENPIVYVTYEQACAEIEIKLPDTELETLTKRYQGEGVFIETDGLVCMHAEHFTQSWEQEGEQFVVLDAIAKDAGGVKLYTKGQQLAKENPSYLAYDFYVKEAGEYQLIMETEPANARAYQDIIRIGYAVNDGAAVILPTVSKTYVPGVSKDWEEGVLRHVRQITTRIQCKKGRNTFRYYPIAGENVLERILVIRQGHTIPESYLGPSESIRS